MEIQATTTSSANATNTAAGQKSGKTDGGNSPFGSLLQTMGAQKHENDKKQGTDPLSMLLAALAGGLNPLALQQTPTVQTADGLQGTTPVANVMLGTRTLSVPVNGLPLQNGELAALLENFGASANLLGVLKEQPDQQPAQTLAAHPELLADLGQALTNLISQATQNSQQLATSPKAALMEGLFAQLLQTAGSEEQADASESQTLPNAGSQKQPLFGKLQATMLTSHSLQVLTTSQQQDVATVQPTSIPSLQATVLTASLLAADQPVQEQVMTGNALDGTQLQGNPLTAGQAPLQSVRADQLARMQPVVTLHADSFNNEFANLLVKRAALLEAPGRHEFRIVMQPQGLGEIEVRVQAIGNQISMHLSADSAATKGLLDSNLSGLKSQLQAQGIQFDRIEVSTTNSSNNNSQNGSLNSGLPHERQSGQNSQGQSGNQSNRKRSNEERFSLDGIDALNTANQPHAEEIDEDASLDVTA